MSIKKIFYILPCYNESLNLNKLLKDFSNFFKSKKVLVKIIIVDDGSRDNSIKVINKFQKNNFYKNISIKILQHKKNMGLGKALKTGFEYCFSKGKNDDILVSMDTDNSHTVNLSYKMVNKIKVLSTFIKLVDSFDKQRFDKFIKKYVLLFLIQFLILFLIFFDSYAIFEKDNSFLLSTALTSSFFSPLISSKISDYY